MWIDSDSTVKQHDMPTAISDESESKKDKLLRTKLEMEQKLKDAQNKLLQQKMEAKARTFHIICIIRDFRATVMECYGTAKTDERLVGAHNKFCEEVETISHMGYMFHVGEDFMGRVERSILAGQTPEQQFICTKTDNSEADPILGDVTDIIYEVLMPVIVKRELTDDDDADCEIISVQPAPQDFLPKDVTVKQEKIDPKYDNLDNNGNPVTETEEENKEKEKLQAHKDEVAEGDTEENKDKTGDAENMPKKPQKNSKKKPSVAPAGKRTL